MSLDADERDPAMLKHDAYQPLCAVRRAKARWLCGDIDLRGSRTPIDAPLTAFPPTFFTAAQRELLEPDILAFTERLHRAGKPVETHRWRRQVHAFPVLAGLLPESRKAVMLTGQFLRTALEQDAVAARRPGHAFATAANRDLRSGDGGSCQPSGMKDS